MARKKTAAPKHVEAEEAQGGGQEGHGKITKSEAVRRALADGVDQPTEGVAYIKDNFGLEISPGHFSAVKAGEKKKASPASKGKPDKNAKAAVERYLAP